MAAPPRPPPPALGEHHGGSFGVYMAHKKAKLATQFQAGHVAGGVGGGAVGGGEGPHPPRSGAVAGAAGLPPPSTIFAGVRVYVNGYTNPPLDVLKALLGRGGGVHEHYLSSTVTHIVAPNLPDSKIKEIRASKRWIPVVYPQWIVDCSRRGRLMPVTQYLLPAFREAGRLCLPTTAAPTPPRPSPTAVSSSPVSAIAPAATTPGAGKSSTAASLPPPLAMAPGPQAADTGTRGDGRGRHAGNDPLFMQGYFSSSRLHFIGSWRAHVQARVAQGQNRVLAGATTTTTTTTTATSGVSASGGMPPLSPSPSSTPATGTAASAAPDAMLDAPPSAAAPAVMPAPGRDAVARSTMLTEAGVNEALASRLGVRVIVHIDVDCFFAQVALLDLPQHRNDPVVVAHGGMRPGAVGIHRRGTFGDGMDTGVVPAHVPSTDAAAVPARHVGIRIAGVHDTISGSGGAPSAAHPPPSTTSPGLAAGGTIPTLTTAPANRPPPRHPYQVPGGGEISSANYVARRYGIYAGMTVGTARTLCPSLIVLPYNFDRIQQVSEAVYDAFMSVTPRVQAVSCDEAYLDLSGVAEPLCVVADLRRTILERTGCTVSAGISSNMLLARLATAKAKPDGMYVLPGDAASVRQFMSPLPITVLPGVGWSTSKQLMRRGVTTIAHLLDVPKPQLQEWFGDKTGGALFDHARGCDDRPLQFRKVRKSIGAEVNWGIRFPDTDTAHKFLRNLAAEVAERMARAGTEEAALAGYVSNEWMAATQSNSPTRGRAGGGEDGDGCSVPPLRARGLTFKVMIRRPGAGNPLKHLGHGECDTHNRSITLARATSDASTIAAAAIRLYDDVRPDATQVRGLGIQMTKLEHPALERGAAEAQGATMTLRSWLSRAAPAKPDGGGGDSGGSGAGDWVVGGIPNSHGSGKGGSDVVDVPDSVQVEAECGDGSSASMHAPTTPRQVGAGDNDGIDLTAGAHTPSTVPDVEEEEGTGDGGMPLAIPSPWRPASPVVGVGTRVSRVHKQGTVGTPQPPAAKRTRWDGGGGSAGIVVGGALDHDVVGDDDGEEEVMAVGSSPPLPPRPDATALLDPCTVSSSCTRVRNQGGGDGDGTGDGAAPVLQVAAPACMAITWSRTATAVATNGDGAPASPPTTPPRSRGRGGSGHGKTSPPGHGSGEAIPARQSHQVRLTQAMPGLRPKALGWAQSDGEGGAPLHLMPTDVAMLTAAGVDVPAFLALPRQMKAEVWAHAASRAARTVTTLAVAGDATDVGVAGGGGVRVQGAAGAGGVRGAAPPALPTGAADVIVIDTQGSDSGVEVVPSPGRVGASAPAPPPLHTHLGALADPSAFASACWHEPVSDVITAVRQWARGIGAHPTPQDAAAVCTLVTLFVSNGRVQDGITLLRSLRRMCVEIDRERAAALSDAAAGVPVPLSIMQAWARDHPCGGGEAGWWDVWHAAVERAQAVARTMLGYDVAVDE